MRLFPPPCLTVGVVVLSESGVPFSFQVYTLPSDPFLFIFVSSDYRTLFQSSTVKFSCFWANLRWFCRWACLSSGCFLLDNRAKVPFLGCISHGLGSNRRGKDVIDKMSSLNSIIKLSSSDLMDNWLCITRGKLGRTTDHLCYFPCLNLFFSESCQQ